MDWTTPIYIVLALFLVLINGFFVLAEFALVKVRATRMEELARDGNRKAVLAREMVSHLDKYLSATQLGITVASLALGWIGEPAFAGIVRAIIDPPNWFSPRVSHAISATLAFMMITFLHIWIGESAPKSLAIRRAEKSVLAIAYPMRIMYTIFYIPMSVLVGASNWLLRRFGMEVEHEDVAHSEEELRMLLSTAQESGEFSFNRLLVLENIFDLGTQTVRDAMIPWGSVKSLPRDADGTEVLTIVAEHRYSRWPVLDSQRKPVGYLLAKDLVVHATNPVDWTELIRPLRTVRQNQSLETTLLQLQRDGANMAVVLEQDRPIGLITLEDILEEIVGRIEDEYPRQPRFFLKDALAHGAVAMDIAATSPEAAIESLANLIPPDRLPQGVKISTIITTAVAREKQLSTDIGDGIAIPHARVERLMDPILVFGRCSEGIKFRSPSSEPVRLMFLLVTPLERPNLQVFLLGQIAGIVRNELVRERLIYAESPHEVIEIIDAADPAVTG
jgi:CBS domain containing-hemolysin-like protein